MFKDCFVSVIYIWTPFEVLECDAVSKNLMKQYIFKVVYIENFNSLGCDTTGLLGVYWYAKN